MEDGGPVISYAAVPERFAELVEQNGIILAPYLARPYWVAIERWDVSRASDWARELEAAHAIVHAKLTNRKSCTNIVNLGSVSVWQMRRTVESCFLSMGAWR